jgi:hypothetical protein
VGGCAEPHESEHAPFREAGQPERPVPDGAGAEERCGFGVREHVGDSVGERLPDDEVLSIAAVGVAASCPKLVAKVLLARAAV